MRRTSSFKASGPPVAVPHKVRVKVRGLAGVIVKRDECRDVTKDTQAPPPPQEMSAVVTVKNGSKTSGSSNLSRSLKPAPTEKIVVRMDGDQLDTQSVVTEGNQTPQGVSRYVCVWHEQQPSVIELETLLRQASRGGNSAGRLPKRLELIISLQSEDGSFPACPIGVGELYISSDFIGRRTLIDLPVFTDATLRAEEKKEEAPHRLASIYTIDPDGDAVIRLEVEVESVSTTESGSAKSGMMTPAPVLLPDYPIEPSIEQTLLSGDKQLVSGVDNEKLSVPDNEDKETKTSSPVNGSKQSSLQVAVGASSKKSNPSAGAVDDVSCVEVIVGDNTTSLRLLPKSRATQQSPNSPEVVSSPESTHDPTEPGALSPIREPDVAHPIPRASALRNRITVSSPTSKPEAPLARQSTPPKTRPLTSPKKRSPTPPSRVSAKDEKVLKVFSFEFDEDYSILTDDQTFLTTDYRDPSKDHHPANQLFGLIDGLACGRLHDIVEAEGDDYTALDYSEIGGYSREPMAPAKRAMRKKPLQLEEILDLDPCRLSEFGLEGYDTEGSLAATSETAKKKKPIEKRSMGPHQSALFDMCPVADVGLEEYGLGRSDSLQAGSVLEEEGIIAQRNKQWREEYSEFSAMGKRRDDVTWDSTIPTLPSRDALSNSRTSKLVDIVTACGSPAKKVDKDGDSAFSHDDTLSSLTGILGDSLALPTESVARKSDPHSGSSSSSDKDMPDGVSRPPKQPLSRKDIAYFEALADPPKIRRKQGAVASNVTRIRRAKTSEGSKNCSPKSLTEFPSATTRSSNTLTDTFMNMVGLRGPMEGSHTHQGDESPKQLTVPKVLEPKDHDESIGDLPATTYEMRIDLDACKQKLETATRDAATKVNEAKDLLRISSLSSINRKSHSPESRKKKHDNRNSMVDATAAADAKKTFFNSMSTRRRKRSTPVEV